MSDTVKARRIPDHGERLRALEPGESFIVQAPAGSGKTELLIQRYLVLLAGSREPGEVLAITFTRKAAGEMARRVLEALERAARDEKGEDENTERTLGLARRVLARDREHGWDLLQNPSRLRIQTMDSLAASLASRMPILSRMGPSVSPTESPDELYREAALKTASMVDDDGARGEAVRNVLSHLDNSVEGLVRRLSAMLSKRDQWMRHLVGIEDPAGLRERLEGGLRRAVEDALARLSRSFPEGLAPALIETANYAAGNLKEKGGEGPVTALQGLTGAPGGRLEDLPIWRGVRELLLTKEGTPRKRLTKNEGFPAGKGVEKTMKDKLSALLEDLSGTPFVTELADVAKLPDPVYGDADWEALRALIDLLPVAAAHLKEVFRARAEVDFQEVSMAAVSSLGGEEDPTELMLSVDMELRHILVDEYQDTSRTQLALIESLVRGWEPGDGRTLFVVGDPMQSIYLFREAEVGLFLQARSAGIGPVRLTPINLVSNFRSQGKIVEWVNRSFPGAFPETEDTFLGSVTFALSEAVKEELERAHVDVRCFRERDDAREAEEIADIVEAAAGETAAVLTRSRGHLDSVIRAFKARGISFSSRDIDPLGERPVVVDLMSLARALSHPWDHLAWLSVLRAPWCGLATADLHKLAHGRNSAPVWTLAKDPEAIGELSEDGKKRLERFTGPVERALSLWSRTDPRSVLEGLWTALGGPACLQGPAGMEDAGVFLDLVDGASSSGGLNLSELDTRLSGLFAAPASEDGAVEVMTIHKAKGLEFDHVILPGMGKAPRPGDRELMLWLERGDDLLLAPVERRGGREGPVYEYLRHVHGTREDLERTRLLYVAATRAKKTLHVFAHARDASAERVDFYGKSLFSAIGHSVEPDMVKDRDAREGVPASEPATLKRLPAAWTLPEPAPPVESPPEREWAGESEPEFHWSGVEARFVGTVVHRYLCRIAGEGLADWDDKKVQAEGPRIRAMLVGLGCDQGSAPGAAQRAVEVIKTCLADERGRWLLEDHSEGGVEVELTARLPERSEPVRVVIDRTFVDSSGTRWVVDYKTGRHEGGSVEEFLKSEKERYRGQLETYSRALEAGGEARPVKRALYYPALAAWIEW